MSIIFCLAQVNFLVGDIEGNTQRILKILSEHHHTAKKEKTIFIFPELSLTGYPPEDLLMRPEFYIRIQAALDVLCKATHNPDAYLILGYPEADAKIHAPQDSPTTLNTIFNAAAVIHQEKVIATARKQYLPNYGVFDESRYFTSGGKNVCVFEVMGKKIGVLICEDLWYPEPVQHCKEKGAEYIVSIHASPFNIGKSEAREKMLQQRAQETRLPILYVNYVGGQDELVFDGDSMVINAEGKIILQAPYFEEKIISLSDFKTHLPLKTESRENKIYNALKLAAHDYIHKNHFKGALIGLSGGIDSALTLAIAYDALGAEKVTAVLMPSQFTAAMSVEDAETQAKILGVKTKTISIDGLWKQYVELLSCSQPLTLQNLQARIRGVLLMALSNETGSLVLTTSNKSELAVGYTTIYGDMAGGFCVLKDVLKTDVYALALYRNSISPVIPERVLTRAPSAELALNQKDQDTLPAYELLDRFLKRYIEDRIAVEQLLAEGFPKETVEKILTLLKNSEYKRKQAPLGPRVSRCGFGKDWRFPVTGK